MSTATPIDLLVDPDLEKFLNPPDAARDAALEKDLIQNGGALDAIKVWKGKNVIIDGHRRYRLCKKNNLPFPVKYLDFDSVDALKYWMDLHQWSRRNQTPQEDALSLARMEEFVAKTAGKRSGAAKKVAAEAGVDVRTVFRAKQFKRALCSLPKSIGERISSGELTISHEDMLELATFDEAEQFDIVSQYDSGEFKSLHEVLKGVESEDDDFPTAPEPKKTDKVSLKPITELVRDCEEALGQLYKAIDHLDTATDNAPKYHTVRSRLREIGDLVRAWGKESLEQAAKAVA